MTSKNQVRIRALQVALICLVPGILGFGTSAALAQGWPTKPIKILVSFAPGGVTDLVARAIQPKLTESLGQPVIIENHPGAGGTIAEAMLAKATPDGYTLLMTADSISANPYLFRNLSYDSLKDLQPISLLVRVPMVLLVNNSVPANSLTGFLEYARLNPGKISYASPGSGTSNHLYFEIFKEAAKLDIVHTPYKGGGPAMADLLGGHVEALLISTTLAVPQIQGGKVKALAVTTERRIPELPGVPTFAEAGFPGFAPQQWTGLFAPSGTPPNILTRIGGEFGRAIKDPANAARLTKLGAEPVVSSADELTNLLKRDGESLGKIIRKNKISFQ